MELCTGMCKQRLKVDENFTSEFPFCWKHCLHCMLAFGQSTYQFQYTRMKPIWNHIYFGYKNIFFIYYYFFHSSTYHSSSLRHYKYLNTQKRKSSCPLWQTFWFIIQDNLKFCSYRLQIWKRLTECKHS